MVRPIMHDPIFLARPSVPATPEDVQIGQDLLETLEAHKEGCVGMAANMIGVSKRIIAVDDEGKLSAWQLLPQPPLLQHCRPGCTVDGHNFALCHFSP